MSPRRRPLRIVALATSLALAALFVAYRVSSASREKEVPAAAPAAVSPTAGAPPAAIPAAAPVAEDATEEEQYFPGSKSGLIAPRPKKPLKGSKPAPSPTPPPQAPAK